jgi:hypothetical protein
VNGRRRIVISARTTAHRYVQTIVNIAMSGRRRATARLPIDTLPHRPRSVCSPPTLDCGPQEPYEPRSTSRWSAGSYRGRGAVELLGLHACQPAVAWEI